ncbi:hypothetical protein TIFTF001_025173 [Ficus carica]|uniref:Uncharacterized protein n=1 Tax=Ficus carica TaxID=3494 RepID=A0AA88ANC1_FICCA|nr:hypothetical protein TIFTF001_025173 [Ficus carica]
MGNTSADKTTNAKRTPFDHKAILAINAVTMEPEVSSLVPIAYESELTWGCHVLFHFHYEPTSLGIRRVLCVDEADIFGRLRVGDVNVAVANWLVMARHG